MSISAMKLALEALENTYAYLPRRWGGEVEADQAISALRQAIAEAEKTIYVDSSRFPKDQLDHKPGMVITAPVHASDISQEFVDKTAKREHEWVEQPDLARVGEVGVWGEEKNT